MATPGIGSARRIGWLELVIAAVVCAVLLAADFVPTAASWVARLLHVVAIGLFVLFAMWFARTVRASVKLVPSSMLPAYAALVGCWGVAFFYPFPIRTWRQAVWRDLVFHVGVILPAIGLLAAAALKLLFSSDARHRWHRAISPGQRGRIVLGLTVWMAFCVWFGLRAMLDAQDLMSVPRTTVDTILDTYRGLRSGEQLVRCRTMGTLRLPHGIWFTFRSAVERGLRVRGLRVC